MTEDRTAILLAWGAVAIVGVAALLEGATLPVQGGMCIVAVGALALVPLTHGGIDRLSRMSLFAIGGLGLTLVWHIVPWPTGIRALVAPGQTALLQMAAPEWAGDLGKWLDGLARFDVSAAVGE